MCIELNVIPEIWNKSFIYSIPKMLDLNILVIFDSFQLLIYLEKYFELLILV